MIPITNSEQHFQIEYRSPPIRSGKKADPLSDMEQHLEIEYPSPSIRGR